MGKDKQFFSDGVLSSITRSVFNLWVEITHSEHQISRSSVSFELIGRRANHHRNICPKVFPFPKFSWFSLKIPNAIWTFGILALRFVIRKQREKQLIRMWDRTGKESSQIICYSFTLELIQRHRMNAVPSSLASVCIRDYPSISS